MLTGLTKCGVEGSDCRVGANGRERGHVQYAPELGPATTDAGVPRKVPLSRLKRRLTDKGGNLFAGQRSQFRQVSKQSHGQHRSDPRHRPKQLVALAPDRRRTDQIRGFIVEALFKPTDVLIDAAPNNLGSVGAAILLGGEHRYQLVAAHYEC